MTERSGFGEPKLSITHQQAIDHPELRKQYREEIKACKKEEYGVFELRNFGPDDHLGEGAIILDYYVGFLKRGIIDGNEQDGYTMYELIEEDGDVSPHQLNGEPIDVLYHAEDRLRKAIRRTDALN